MYRDPSFLDLLFFLAVAGFLAYSVAKDRLSADQTPEERIREQYADGEIDDQTLERELAFHVDDRNEAIQNELDRIQGVGDVTSTLISEYAEWVVSMDSCRSADWARSVSDPQPKLLDSR